jgi:radical SAM superfamily enzyme YgiQ (UPF0313 family)
MKIALIFPPFYLESLYNLPPLGLVNLATALKGHPHQVVVMDFVLAIRQGALKMGRALYDDCAEMILEQAPDVVGFSAQCTTYPCIIQISEGIKQRKPDTRIVLGGHNASFLDRETLERFPVIDAIVRGEGEVTFKELVTAYEEGKDETGITGVTFRHGKDIVRNRERELVPDLDKFPTPDYSFLPSFSQYRDACSLPRSIAIIEVGRGCPHQCIYCSESILWRRRTRTFSPSRLVSEMKNLHENHEAECFLLAYDQFTANRRFVESFCRKVIENELNHLPWYCISRLDSLDSSLLALMREAGCESMCYGIDSGSKKTLAFIRKNINHEILYSRVVETADQGIIPTLSFVIGFPEEERRDIDETLTLALRSGIVGNSNPLIQLPTVLPGTDLHIRYGKRLVRKADTYFALGLEFDGGKRLESDEELINADPMIFSSFYNLPCPGLPIEELNLIAQYFPLMVQLYPKSFLLLSLEYKESISGLFISWLKWAKGYLKREQITLSPKDCYLHFRDFVSELMIERGEPERRHLPEVLRYENVAIEVARSSGESRPFHIDLHHMKEFKPMADENAIVEEFDFDLPVIILDMKNGNFQESYYAEKTVLIFQQEGDILDVYEINPFVRDFLETCDGKTDLSAILRQLFTRHGGDMKEEDFFDSCAEGVKSLGEKGLIGI